MALINVMRHWCTIICQLNPKTCDDVKNGRLKAIKAVLRLSRRLVHPLKVKVGLIFNHLQPQNQSSRRLRFIWDTGVPP